MTTITNPILPGFNPDPCICRAGDDYYIAVSTFEYFPGVCIHHSRDLVHWHLIGHALTTARQLPLLGVENSAGVWAPHLSHHDGRFHLIYTNMLNRTSPFKDLGNFLITADDIRGPWSDPIHLNGSGFDPSLFHDDDGRKWLVNMRWDHRHNHQRFAGIILQEYDPAAERLTGPVHTIMKKAAMIEGPQICKRGGWYYLVLAEGGTGVEHAVSMARSRTITGPYELDPQPYVLTSRDAPDNPLQKAGHASLVELPDGSWYMPHLCGRPVGEHRRCILGRETAIQKVAWSDDGWLHLHHGGTAPQVDVPAPVCLPAHPWAAEPTRDDFDRPAFSPHWSALRVPIEPAWADLSARPGWVRLFGRESTSSWFYQSSLLRRQTHLTCTAQTCVDFQPDNFSQMAGLIYWYDSRKYFYLRVSHDQQRGRVLGIALTDDGYYSELTDHEITIGDWPHICLRAELDHVALQFAASPDGRVWQPIGPVLDATKISDEYGTGMHFTGAMIGICCQDLTGKRQHADFDYFELR